MKGKEQVKNIQLTLREQWQKVKRLGGAGIGERERAGKKTSSLTLGAVAKVKVGGAGIAKGKEQVKNIQHQTIQVTVNIPDK